MLILLALIALVSGQEVNNTVKSTIHCSKQIIPANHDAALDELLPQVLQQCDNEKLSIPPGPPKIWSSEAGHMQIYWCTHSDQGSELCDVQTYLDVEDMLNIACGEDGGGWAHYEGDGVDDRSDFSVGRDPAGHPECGFL